MLFHKIYKQIKKYSYKSLLKSTCSSCKYSDITRLSSVKKSGYKNSMYTE